MCPPASADQATIDAAAHDSWQSTCKILGGLTGDPDNDAAVFMEAVHTLQEVYEMDLHDAAAATGQIIGQRCPQYKPNIDALNKHLQNS
ncbi:hypothetical protein [Mycobacterium sp.]|jgi:hypothetical protein|uniref:hypothetical protein n=1 Tax=Mycobacterium sp. TaxID=1785 RepID=UPI003C73C7F6